MFGKVFSLCAATFASALLLSAPAWACGGMFCGAPGPQIAPAPVDQTAERIVFEVLPAGQVAAHVNISYTGDADDFAWIVPVPPDVNFEESPEGFIDDMFAATDLQVFLPAQQPCPSPSSSAGGCIGCASEETGALFADATNEAGGRGTDSSVEVLERFYTDTFEAVLVTAAMSDELVGWLQDNSYNVSDNMTPVMQPYIDGGMVFLAVKLRGGAEASDIVPIVMTYSADKPMIPIQLTAVAAQPLMGIAVIISAPVAFVPENYDTVVADTSEIFFDAARQTTYFEWVARAADERDGKAFVPEYRDASPFGGGQVLSRYYTRMHAHHMTLDPVFAPAPDATSVANLLDLSAQASPFLCGGGVDEELLANACAFNYCGAGGECGIVDGRVACRCPVGDVAQPVTGPDGSAHVTCVPAENPLGITAEAGGAGTLSDPCNDYDCGAGVCVLRAGFPTCDCEDGAVACLEDDASVFCVQPPDFDPLGPGAGPEAGPLAKATPAAHEPGVRAERTGFAGGAWWLALVVFGALRWRRADA